MKTLDTDLPATKKDVEEIVGRVVGEIVSDALQFIANRLDENDKLHKQTHSRLDRAEKRLDNLVGTVDRHSYEIADLQAATA